MSESQKIILKDPTGRSVTYGAYDNIMVNTTEGKTLYSKLPPVNSQNNSEVLSVVDGIWSKRKLDQPDWQIANKQAEGYIKNRPFYEEIVDEIWKVTESSTVYITQEGTPIGVQLSTHTPKAEEMLLATIKVTVPSVGYEDVSISLSSESLLEGKDYSFFGEIGLGVFYKSGKISITDQGITEVVNVPSAGIYYLFGQSLEEAQGLEFKVKFVQKENLDNKYLSIWNGGLEKFGNFIDTSKAQKEWNEQFGKYVWTLFPLERSAARTDITEAWKKGTKLNIRATMLGQVKEYICYPYEVEYNGQKYKAYGEGSWLGFQGGGEPFLIAGTLPSDDEPFMCMVFDLISGQQENRITHIECDVLIEQELKIDEKYLPENFGKGGASEWEQLSNKPFYQGYSLLQLLSKTTLFGDDFSGVIHNHFEWKSRTYYENLLVNLEEGRRYKVVFDEQPYYCEAYTRDNELLGTVIMLGNKGSFLDQSAPATEPFYFTTIPGLGYTSLDILEEVDTNIDHTIEVYVENIEPKINSNALPYESKKETIVIYDKDLQFEEQGEAMMAQIEVIEDVYLSAQRANYNKCELVIDNSVYSLDLNRLGDDRIDDPLWAAGGGMSEFISLMYGGNANVFENNKYPFTLLAMPLTETSENMTKTSFQILLLCKKRIFPKDTLTTRIKLTFCEKEIEPFSKEYLQSSDWSILKNRPFGSFDRKKFCGGKTTIVDDIPIIILASDQGDLIAEDFDWSKIELVVDGESYFPVSYQTDDEGVIMYFDEEGGKYATALMGVILFIDGFGLPDEVYVYTVAHEKKIDPKWLPYSADAMLPSVTVQDKGKFLCVNDDGLWQATTILNVSEVGL